jgi:hypothetical protein
MCGDEESTQGWQKKLLAGMAKAWEPGKENPAAKIDLAGRQSSLLDYSLMFWVSRHSAAPACEQAGCVPG